MTMDEPSLRRIIRQKLQDGRLPHDRIPRVWSSPGDGEECDACGMVLAREQLLMEGTSLAGGMPIQFHVRCFSIWDQERRVLPRS